MLPEKPNAWVAAWWKAYCRSAIRRHFHALRFYGDAPPEQPIPPRPEPGTSLGTLYLANHLSFWDGIVLHHLLVREYGHPSIRVMVDEEQVRRHPFFRRVGAFSVDRRSPRDALRAIHHGAQLLNSGLPVLLFPQGAIRPAGEPLKLERGFTYLLDRAPGARVVVFSLAYEFWEHQRPEILLHASSPKPGASFGMDDAAEHFNSGQAALRAASLTRAPGRVLLERRFDIRSLRFPMPR